MFIKINFNFRRSDYYELLQDETDSIPLQSDSNRQLKIRQEQVLEAEVQRDDTILSLAIRLNCSVQDIKRLNKIEKDNEIFAFKVVKVPLTTQNLLLDTLPKVHKSGQSSPNTRHKEILQHEIDATQKEKLEEKLLVASVSSAVISKPEDAADRPVNEIETAEDPLVDRRHFRGYPRQIAPKNDFLSFNGSDCELNWIVLLVCILAVCVIVPLIIFYMVYEYPEKFEHHEHIKYDDPDLGPRQHQHLNDVHVSTHKS